MQYNHTTQQSMEFLKKALERIEQEKLPASPDMYQLWYCYYAELMPELKHAIETLKHENDRLTYGQCRELYDHYLDEEDRSEQVREAGEKITEAIKSVGGVVTNARNATSQYNLSLEAVTTKLSDDKLDLEQAKKVIGDVVSNTQNMLAQNQKLEEELSKSTEAMQSLQRDLERVRKEAFTDSLTSLANRKSFDLEIARVALEAQESGQIFSLLMMDIDHFKSFNDNYGHQVGDQVLRLVAKTLLDGVKGRDIVARYGGEEFCIIFPETKLEGGLKVADNLRRAVASKEVINRNTGKKLGRITLSGGVTSYIAGESVESIIGRADAALYEAKNNGRNQIVAGKVANKKENVPSKKAVS